MIELDLATLDFIFDTMIGTMTIMAVFSLAGLVWALKPAPTRFDWVEDRPHSPCPYLMLTSSAASKAR